MSDLLYSVGLDITDLKTSARAAKEQADDIKRGFKGFKDVIEFGGVGAAVFGFFRSVIAHAMELKGPLDDNTAAVRRFGGALTEAKEGTLSWGAQVLGFWNRAGEGIGMTIRAMIDGSAQVRQAAQTEREAQEAIVAMEKERKANGEALKKISADLAELDRERTKLALADLTTQEKVNLAVQQVRDARAAEAASAGSTLERRKLHLATQQAEVDLLRQFGVQDKENADKKSKTDEAATKAAEEHIKLADKLVKLRFEALSDEEKLLSLETEHAGIIAAIADDKQRGADTTQAEISLLENINAIEAVRLKLVEARAAAERTAAKEAAEAAKAAQIAEELARRERAAKSIQFRSGADFANASDDALEEIVRRNRQKAIELRNNGQGLNANYFNRQEAGRLQAEANNAEQELRLRQGIRSSFARGGEQQVFSDFQHLDPVVLDRLIGQFAQQQTTATQSARDLSQINQRLAQVFKLGG
jgi:hypothetical protein